MNKPKAIIISGPTASGKSGLALEMAKEFAKKGFSAEIISADSAQVYRHMDIGTDKLPEAERMGIPHYLIDVVNPDEHFDAAVFRVTALKEIERINAHTGVPILVGGTGFWIRALVYGLFTGPARDEVVREELNNLAKQKGPDYLHQLLSELDPESAKRIHPHDLNRLIRSLEVQKLTGKSLSDHFKDHQKEPALHALHIALNIDRSLLHERINQRVEEMMAKGFLEEVKKLREMGYGPDLESQKIIGYRQLHQHIDGELTLDQAVHEIKKQTRHYARRQLVWLRGQKEIAWFDALSNNLNIFTQAFKFMEESK
jgi:tRNA dimethylallyltransferase